MGRTLLLAACVAGAAVWGAETKVDLQAFAGTWKEDLALSKLTTSNAVPLSYSQSPDGSFTEMRGAGANAIATEFRMDGKEYPNPGVPGATVTWEAAGPNAWLRANKRGGLVLNTMRYELAGDAMLTITQSRKLTNGEEDLLTRVYQRTGGTGHGLAGAWKEVSTKRSRPRMFTYVITAGGELKYVDPETHTTFTAKPDGKPNPYTGASVLSNITIAVEALGPRSIREVLTRNGEAILRMTFTISDDGMTMTMTSQAPGATVPPSVEVFHKQ